MNIEMFSGDTRRLVITIKDKFGNIANLADDLNDVVFKISENPIGRSEYNSSAVVTKQFSLQDSNGGAIDISGISDGILKITINTEDTQNLYGKYFFDVRLFMDYGEVVTTAEGQLTIRKAL